LREGVYPLQKKPVCIDCIEAIAEKGRSAVDDEMA